MNEMIGKRWNIEEEMRRGGRERKIGKEGILEGNVGKEYRRTDQKKRRV